MFRVFVILNFHPCDPETPGVMAIMSVIYCYSKPGTSCSKSCLVTTIFSCLLEWGRGRGRWPILSFAKKIKKKIYSICSLAGLL